MRFSGRIWPISGGVKSARFSDEVEEWNLREKGDDDRIECETTLYEQQAGHAKSMGYDTVHNFVRFLVTCKKNGLSSFATVLRLSSSRGRWFRLLGRRRVAF
jgi:hypothetical protein